MNLKVITFLNRNLISNYSKYFIHNKVCVTAKTIFCPFLILIVFSASFNLSAQTRTKSIYGNVFDSKTSERLIGVNIILYDDSLITSTQISGIASNIKGYFKFDNLEKGEYWIKASYIGYETFTHKIQLTNSDFSVELNIPLIQKPLNFDQIIVEASRDTLRSISTIDISPEFINNVPSISGEPDVFKTLTLLPGVTTSSEISNGLYIRGGSPDQTLTLIDGVIAYNPFHLGGFASTFNSDALKNVRLIKGAFPAEYGGRLSSVLDIKLRDGSKEKFKGVLGIGTLGSRLTIEGPIGNNFTYLFAVRKYYVDFLINILETQKNIPLYNFFDFNGKISFMINEVNKISLSGLYNKDNLISKDESLDASYNIDWGNSTLSFSWLNLAENRKFTKVSLNYTNYNFNTLISDKNPDAFRNDFYSESFIEDFSLKVDGQYFSMRNHSVKNGFEIILHNFDLVNNNFFNPSVSSDDRVRSKYNSTEISGYIQDHWKLTPYLFSNFGVRLFYLPISSYFQIEPRVAVTVSPLSGLFIKIAASSVNQFLHLIVRNDVILPTDLWLPSTKNIKPSNLLQFVAGIEYNFNNDEYVLSIEGYNKELKNLYEYSDTATFTYEIPIDEQLTEGKGKSYGVELFLNKRKGKLTGWVGYTLSWTRRNFENLNLGKPFYPRYDRRHDISLILTYELSNAWNVSMTWKYSTGQAFTMPIGQYYYPGVFSQNGEDITTFLDYKYINEYRLPPYHKLDLSSSYRFKLDNYLVSITLGLFNVYNRQNPLGRYINFSKNQITGQTTSQLKQFTLFPFFPSLSLNVTL